MCNMQSSVIPRVSALPSYRIVGFRYQRSQVRFLSGALQNTGKSIQAEPPTVAGTVADGSGICPNCSHPAVGVREFRRVVCAHGETDDGIGDVDYCHCRHDSHARQVVGRRVVE